ncbi:hypothetical protein ACWJJH_13625 [Endozoicomonadaceae bacterium StTr2]
MSLPELQSLLKQNQNEHQNCLQQLAIYLERGESNSELIKLIESYHYDVLRHEAEIRQLLAGAPMQQSSKSPSHDESLEETMGRW